MLKKRICIPLAIALAVLLGGTTTFAADPEPPKPVTATSAVIGDFSCIPGTIESYESGAMRKCTLAANKAVPSTEIVCQMNRSINFHPDGALQECRIDKNATFPSTDITCQANSTVTLHPDGSLQRGLLDKDKEVMEREVICSKNNPISFHPNGKLAACTPNDYSYVRGKGSCLPNSEVTFYPDGVTQSCMYTTPVYQNTSCKVGEMVVYHPNKQYKECTLPEDKIVFGSGILCKADAPVTYGIDGAILKCTLATPAEITPGQLPAGTVVQFDSTGKIINSEIPTIPAK